MHQIWCCAVWVALQERFPGFLDGSLACVERLRSMLTMALHAEHAVLCRCTYGMQRIGLNLRRPDQGFGRRFRAEP